MCTSLRYWVSSKYSKTLFYICCQGDANSWDLFYADVLTLLRSFGLKNIVYVAETLEITCLLPNHCNLG